MTADAQRRQLGNRLHLLQQRPVMADHDRARPPSREQSDKRRAPLCVQIIGGLIQKQEIGLGKDRSGQRRPRPLAA